MSDFFDFNRKEVYYQIDVAMDAYNAVSVFSFAEDVQKQNNVAQPLQRAIDTLSNMVQRAIKLKGYRSYKSKSDAFVVLVEEGIFTGALAEEAPRMAGFRNILIYDYRSQDPDKIEYVLLHQRQYLLDCADILTTLGI